MKVAEGNLLECAVDVIVQQCNCCTMKPHGLSEGIASRYPYANPYAPRTAASANICTIDSRGVPGTCQILEGAGPAVACLMAQIAPGKPGVWARRYGVDARADSADARQMYFEQALQTLGRQIEARGWKTVAFPHGIGCGLARGKMQAYCKMIRAFESTFAVDTLIVKLPL